MIGKGVLLKRRRLVKWARHVNGGPRVASVSSRGEEAGWKVFSFAMGPIPRSWLRLGWAVAASVSEWRLIHSLTLAATSEMKNVEGIWHRSGLIKCPGACSGDVYSRWIRYPEFTRLRRRQRRPGLDSACSRCSHERERVEALPLAHARGYIGGEADGTRFASVWFGY